MLSEIAVTKIQRIVRGFLGRKRAGERRLEVKRSATERYMRKLEMMERSNELQVAI